MPRECPRDQFRRTLKWPFEGYSIFDEMTVLVFDLRDRECNSAIHSVNDIEAAKMNFTRGSRRRPLD